MNRLTVISRGLNAAVLAAPLLFVTQANLQAQTTSTRHVHQVVKSGEARFYSALPSSQRLRLHVVLPPRDRVGLEQFLADIYNPESPNFRNFLTPAEFTERFGPTEQDYDALTNYVRTNGFRIVGGSRDGMDVQIEGSVGTVEKAFHVVMNVYQHPTENRTFYSPDREPTLGLPFRVWHISGLDNYSTPQPRLVRSDGSARATEGKPGTPSRATTGSGPAASFLGSDMRAAYYGGTLTGAGQTVGLLEYQGTNLDDVNTYYKNTGQSHAGNINLISVDGTSPNCAYTGRRGSCDDTEPTLDITQALGMAPAANVLVFIGSSDTAILSAMTTHSPLPGTIGCSWGWTPADPGVLDVYFQKMAAQGQNFFAASGDNSTWKASGSSEAWPADDAWVVSVGGTTLQTTSAGGAWNSETAWKYSGGGISPDGIKIPSWQTPAINSSNGGSATLRNGPDVAANADFSFYVCADLACTANQWGGTSFAAPMWAGYMALVNQQSLLNKNGMVGFINPIIYGAGYATYFHDITSGTSGSNSTVAGYDLVTGWGSPNGTGLITALSSFKPSPNFTISATSPVMIAQSASGNSTITTTISGGYNSSIALSASGQPSGVTVSFSPVTITAPGSGTSNMTITVGSSVLPGNYTITVTGNGGGTQHTASVSLTVVTHRH
jgi:kumamolisin